MAQRILVILGQPSSQSLSAASPKAPNLARLDWGKFDTIYPVSQRAALAMNRTAVVSTARSPGKQAGCKPVLVCGQTSHHRLGGRRQAMRLGHDEQA